MRFYTTASAATRNDVIRHRPVYETRAIIGPEQVDPEGRLAVHLHFM